MYKYTLTVLEKVSFDTTLFVNELKKATERLLPHELQELRLWLNGYVYKHPHLSPARLVLTN